MSHTVKYPPQPWLPFQHPKTPNLQTPGSTPTARAWGEKSRCRSSCTTSVYLCLALRGGHFLHPGSGNFFSASLSSTKVDANNKCRPQARSSIGLLIEGLVKETRLSGAPALRKEKPDPTPGALSRRLRSNLKTMFKTLDKDGEGRTQPKHRKAVVADSPSASSRDSGTHIVGIHF